MAPGLSYEDCLNNLTDSINNVVELKPVSDDLFEYNIAKKKGL